MERAYRVWFESGPAQLVSAGSESLARSKARRLAELDAQDLWRQYIRVQYADPNRAREIENGLKGRTVITKVEPL